MIDATGPRPFHPAHQVGKTAVLALRLAEAENALHALTSGQIDAVVDATGRTYLLRPAQEHLRQSQSHLQAVLDSVADAITVVGRTGIILSENRSVCRVLGYTPEELVGSVVFRLIHNTDVPAVHAAFIAVMEEYEEKAVARFRHLTREGSYRLVEATMGKLQGVSVEALVLTLRPANGHPGRVESRDPAQISPFH